MRTTVVDVTDEFESFAVGGDGHHVEGVSRRRPADRTAAAPTPMPPDFDLGEVEDVVDDAQECVAAAADGLGELALFGVEGGVQQQPGHPDHGVHRGADLVAHRGQERRFLSRCLYGHIPSLLDHLGRQDLLGHVQHDPDQTRQACPVLVDPLTAHVEPAHRPVTDPVEPVALREGLRR